MKRWVGRRYSRRIAVGTLLLAVLMGNLAGGLADDHLHLPVSSSSSWSGTGEERPVACVPDSPRNCTALLASPVVGAQQRQLPFVRAIVESLPEQVVTWLERCLEVGTTRFANTIEVEGRQYLLITGGRDTLAGQHAVEITEVVVVDGDKVVVEAKFSRISQGQEREVHFDLVHVDATGLQARFVATGDDPYIPITALSGIDYLPAIVAESAAIKVFTPAPTRVVENCFTVSGVARVFEACLSYRVLDEEQTVLVDGVVTASQIAPGFVRDLVVSCPVVSWRYFSFTVLITEAAGVHRELYLELYGLDQKHGYERDMVRIPLVHASEDT